VTSWFERSPSALNDLRARLRQSYPTLHARLSDGKVVVSGTLAITDAGAEIDRYCLEVELPADYPGSLPTVWETGQRIPREIDRHVYPANGALCLGLPIELWVTLGGDFSFSTFLEKAVRPYLIGNSLVEEGKPWPFGESSHGYLGALEFYHRILGTDDAAVVGRFLLDLVNGKVRGHWTCPCGSGKVLRNCHGDSVRALREVPTGVILRSVEAMIGILKANAPA
jgi:hypothetical protein